MSKEIAWVEWNPTFICHAPFAPVQPSIAGKFTGCTYCYAAEGMPHSASEARTFRAQETSFEQNVQLIDRIAELGIDRLSLLGGDPQAMKDFPQVMRYACEKIKLVSVTINGVGTAKNVDTLLGIPIVEVSLDSHIPTVANQTRPPRIVEAAMNAVDLLKDHPFLCLSTVVTPQNYPQLDEFLSWAWDHNVKKVNLYPLLGNNDTPEQISLSADAAKSLHRHLESTYPLYRENYCKAGRHVVVNSDGGVLACAAFMGTQDGMSSVENLGQFVSEGLPSIFQQYNFKDIAPTDSLASPGCPGKSLYDSRWQEPPVPLKNAEISTPKTYCMRCNATLGEGSAGCDYCNFEHLSGEPIMMMCSAFSIYNPKNYPKNDFKK